MGIFDAFGGFNNFKTQFEQFQKSMQNNNANPQQMVQDLLNSGKMTQQQFEQFRSMANQITGKNY